MSNTFAGIPRKKWANVAIWLIAGSPHGILSNIPEEKTKSECTTLMMLFSDESKGDEWPLETWVALTQSLTSPLTLSFALAQIQPIMRPEMFRQVEEFLVNKKRREIEVKYGFNLDPPKKLTDKQASSFTSEYMWEEIKIRKTFGAAVKKFVKGLETL